MSFSVTQQIKWKLTLVILGTSSVVLVLGTLAFQFYDRASSRANLLAQVETVAEITADNNASAVAFFSLSSDARDTLRDALNVVCNRSEIDMACFYSGDGALVAAAGTNRVSIAEIPSMAPGVDEQFTPDRLFVKRHVSLRGETVGTIIVCANLKQQVARSRTFLLISLACFVVILGLILLIATRLQRLVSDPIARLARAAQHITTHRDYSVRVENPAKDEVGFLVMAFNQMLSEIERRNHELSDSEERLKLALAASHMGVWQWNLITDAVSWSDYETKVFGGAAAAPNLGTFLERVYPDDVVTVRAALQHSVENRSTFLAEYRMVTPDGQPRWVAHHGQVRCGEDGRPAVLAGIMQDISERKRTEAEHQKLIAKLLNAEEEERRRIARELHDTTTQHLAALKLTLTSLWGSDTGKPDAHLVAESRRLLDQALSEIRTLAYILHPPVLEEFGLIGALKDFAKGVSRRTGVRVLVHAAEFQGRLPRNIELTLFRVVQESVANAVRHSGSKEITIRLARDFAEVRVEVQDFGKGFAADVPSLRSSGVGIAAMQERLALVGGMLNVESDSEGVTVLASAPLIEELAGNAEVPEETSTEIR
ncbi:MAG: hypothetical protein RLY20_3195 [Verrucomicrobiota bacterium]|jgi:PAS domain S-box-containing protein